MMLQKYSKIETLNASILSKFRIAPNSHKCDWIVTEMIDGDHLALYGDYDTGFFKASTRKRFLKDLDVYSAWKDTVDLHKNWVMLLSQQLRSPVIVYGKMTGGHYRGKHRDTLINTVAEYSLQNDYIIHDIKVKGGFIAAHELENVSHTHVLTVAPVLWKGSFNKVIGFPENRLSAVPFLYELPVQWDNEMKGIIMRPIYDMNVGSTRLIMKKLNRKYKEKGYSHYKPVILTEALTKIAVDMYIEACSKKLLDAVLIAQGGYRYNEIDRVTGKYVKLLLDKVNHLKYNLLTNKERSLIHKELNGLCKEQLLRLYRKGEEAA